MERLSSYQLKKYDNIITIIEEQYEKHSELAKEVDSLDNEIIAMGLILKKDLVKKSLFKVFAKIFFSVFDIYDDYSDKISLSEIEKLLSYTGSKFYVVEIYISKSFQSRIIQKNWLVSVTVQNSYLRITKNVNFTKKVANPIVLIIPFQNTVSETTIDVQISWSGTNIWPVLNIASVPIDISYLLHLYSDLKIRNTVDNKVTNLSKLYGFSSTSSKLPILMCNLVCHISTDKFLKVLIKNCCHNYDPRKNCCLSKSEHAVNVKIASGFENAINIELNTISNNIAIHGNVEELVSLRKYLITKSSSDKMKLEKYILKAMKALSKNIENNDHNIKSLVNIYNELINVPL